MADFTVRHKPMFSGVADAMSNKYHMMRCNGRVWLWRVGPSAGDHIYCGTDDPSKREEGFCGRSMEFELDNGESITLHGPWHSNSNALLHATGVDLTRNHLTFVVIGMDRDGFYNDLVIKDVVYQDKDWIEGSFSRGEDIAVAVADKLNKPVVCYSESHGGSSCGFIYPGRLPKEKVNLDWLCETSPEQFNIIR